MSAIQLDPSTPRLQSALDELKAIILKHYPTATFTVYEGEDPEGIYIEATVDVEDTDTVMDIVTDRLLELQVEEGLPVYVIPVRPLGRVLEAIGLRAA